ncbi:MAG: Rhodanese domain protein [Gallionellaceae bacterium]|nr:MAG: Rhodanese domain protein [Gallionellaceae bacterium]
MLQFLENNVLTVSITFISGYMLFWSYFGNRLRGIKEVDTHAAMNLINRQNAVVLDVREQTEYDAGHIINSRLISARALKERIGELEKFRERPIVVVCRSGARATAATALLNREGFAQAHLLVGGVTAWQKASLPLER